MGKTGVVQIFPCDKRPRKRSQEQRYRKTQSRANGFSFRVCKFLHFRQADAVGRLAPKVIQENLRLRGRRSSRKSNHVEAKRARVRRLRSTTASSAAYHPEYRVPCARSRAKASARKSVSRVGLNRATSAANVACLYSAELRTRLGRKKVSQVGTTGKQREPKG
jgi:hypothetical protein